MKKTYETGIQGELAAEQFLCGKGMICLERRFRSKCGEIDLIMMDRDTLVFVEVKTRKTGMPGSGLMSVNAEKQKRIARSAVLYMMANHQMDSAVRFDVVEINHEQILHIADAFQPGGMFYR